MILAAAALSWLAYLLLPVAGSWCVVSRRGQPVRQLGEVLLLGPLVVLAVLLLLTLLRVPCAPWSGAAVVVVGALVAARWRRRREEGRPRGVEFEERRLLFLTLIAVGGLLIAYLGLRVPIFISDPVNIYAPPAVYYAAHQQIHPQLLSQIVEPHHLDYPPLYTVNLTWQFLFAGGYDGFCMKPLGALFLVGLLLELWNLATALGWRRGRIRAVLFFTLLPIVFKEATSGFADLAVTAFLAGSLASLLLWQRGGGRPEAWRAGLFLAAAAATKNEGAAVGLLMLLATLLAARGRRRALWVPLLCWLLATVPWGLWVRAHGIENDLVQGAGQVAGSEGIGRLGTVLWFFVGESVRTAKTMGFTPADTTRVMQFGLVFPAFVLALVVALVRLLGRGRWSLAQAIAPLQLALLAVVFAFTPHDLDWHLNSATNRLLLQCVPALAAFVLATLAGGGRSAQRPDAVLEEA